MGIRCLIFTAGLLAAVASIAAEPQAELRSDALFTTSVQDASAYRQSVAFPDEKRRLQYLDGFDSLAQKWVMPFLPGGV